MSKIAITFAESIRMRILLGRWLASSSSGGIVNGAAQAAFVVGSLLCACARGEPPGETVTHSAEPMVPARPTGELSATDGALARPEPAAAEPAAGLDAANGDPGRLPQTGAMPAGSGVAFDARARALWDAIVSDNPQAAMPFFFPLEAYRQVKDVADPGRDWKYRLVAAYRRDILSLRARLGEAASRAQFLGVEVPASRARWVKPGEEWNKIGYFRVFGSRLRFAVDGEERAFDVKSLISWRGDWYVVHLSAFK